MLNRHLRVHAAEVAVLLFFMAGTAPGEGFPYENEYAFGVDVSFVKSSVDRGREYQGANEVKHPLTIFRDHG